MSNPHVSYVTFDPKEDVHRWLKIKSVLSGRWSEHTAGFACQVMCNAGDRLHAPHGAHRALVRSNV